jgi:hypothetical protein
MKNKVENETKFYLWKSTYTYTVNNAMAAQPMVIELAAEVERTNSR